MRRSQVRQSEDAHRCLHRARRSGGGQSPILPPNKSELEGASAPFYIVAILRRTNLDCYSFVNLDPVDLQTKRFFEKPKI